MVKTEDSLPSDASPEVVAYRLMLHVLEIENRPLGGDNMSKMSRNVVLDAYADCIEAVRGTRPKRKLRSAA